MLDKLLELGKISAVNASRTDDLTADVRGLKSLYDRVGDVEGRLDTIDGAADDAKRKAQLEPAHRQTSLWIVSICLSAISLIVTVTLTIIFHH